MGVAVLKVTPTKDSGAETLKPICLPEEDAHKTFKGATVTLVAWRPSKSSPMVLML